VTSHRVILSAAELQLRLNDPDWVVIDCRHDLTDPRAGELAFHRGHLPGALHAHVDRDLSDKSPGPDGEFRGRHPLPSRETFILTLRAWGIHQHTQVVAYDAQGGMFAARLWWMLRWVGHEAVAVLDGGLPAWLAAGGGLQTDTGKPDSGTIELRPSLVHTVDAGDLLANLAQPERLVIDARSPDRFRGENETLDPVGGHIPGARNRFFKDNLQADGRFKPAGQLRQEWTAILAAPEKAVMHCGSGVTGCHNLLALEIAGLGGAALYPGSWSEWCADPKRPIATGP
jgi:thiosulfate/3-mercaptopyruvate sulfurtransferase